MVENPRFAVGIGVTKHEVYRMIHCRDGRSKFSKMRGRSVGRSSVLPFPYTVAIAVAAAIAYLFAVYVTGTAKRQRKNDNGMVETRNNKLTSLRLAGIVAAAARDVCSCTSLSVFVYRVRALSVAETYISSKSERLVSRF